MAGLIKGLLGSYTGGLLGDRPKEKEGGGSNGGMSMDEMQNMIQDLQARLDETEKKNSLQQKQYGVSGGALDQLGAQATNFGGQSATTDLAQGTGGATEYPMTVTGSPTPTARFPNAPPGMPPPAPVGNPSGVAAFSQLTPDELNRMRGGY